MLTPMRASTSLWTSPSMVFQSARPAWACPLLSTSCRRRCRGSDAQPAESCSGTNAPGDDADRAVGAVHHGLSRDGRTSAVLGGALGPAAGRVAEGRDGAGPQQGGGVQPVGQQPRQHRGPGHRGDPGTPRHRQPRSRRLRGPRLRRGSPRLSGLRGDRFGRPGQLRLRLLAGAVRCCAATAGREGEGTDGQGRTDHQGVSSWCLRCPRGVPVFMVHRVWSAPVLSEKSKQCCMWLLVRPPDGCRVTEPVHPEGWRSPAVTRTQLAVHNAELRPRGRGGGSRIRRRLARGAQDPGRLGRGTRRRHRPSDP